MPAIAFSELEAMLQKHLGTGTVVDDQPDAPFSPNAVSFYNEDPDGIRYFSKKPVLDVSLVLDEGDDNHKYRLDRVGDKLIYGCYDESTTQGLYHIAGSAVVCEMGSNEELDFLNAVLKDLCEHASDPLRSVMQAVKEAGGVLAANARTAVLETLELA